ncbi:MAG: hypothetical protein ACXVEF_30890 [Polyangiales bacterium]
MRTREAGLFAVGSLCVGFGVYDAVRATIALGGRTDVFARYEAVSDDDLARRLRSSVAHLLLAPVVVGIAWWNTRAPALRYASFAVAILIVVVSAIRIARWRPRG